MRAVIKEENDSTKKKKDYHQNANWNNRKKSQLYHPEQ